MSRFDRILPGLLLPELFSVPFLAARDYENPDLAFIAPDGWHLDDRGEREGRRFILLGACGLDGKKAIPRLLIVIESRKTPLCPFEEFIPRAEQELRDEAAHSPSLTISSLYGETYRHHDTPCAQVSMERRLGDVPVLVDMRLLFDASPMQHLLHTTVTLSAEAEHLRDYIDVFLPSLRFRQG